MRVLFLLLILSGAAVQPALAQLPSGVRLRGEAEAVRTRKRLTEAQQKLADGKSFEAMEELQKILDEAGDELVLVKDNHFESARRLIQATFAALPAKVLDTYRARIDEPAKSLLKLGLENRNPKPLRELVDRYFVSPHAETAILTLAELAMERGDFADAQRLWAMLIPSQDSSAPSFPGAKTDPLLLNARIALSLILAGETPKATQIVEALKQSPVKTTGKLGGETGAAVELLTKWLAKPLPLQPAEWTAFGGRSSRDGRITGELPRYWPSRPTWKTPIPRDPTDKDKPRPGSFPAAKALAFHPVVLEGLAYIADAGRVFQFNLDTGEARLAFHFNTLANAPDIETKDLALPCLLEADFTLCVDRGKLFARLGPPALPSTESDKKLRSVIVELEPKRGVKLAPDDLTLLARRAVAPPANEKLPAAWEGAPIVADDCWFAAFVRYENNRLIHAIACYGPGQGSPLWVVDVCDADATRSTGVKNRNVVLTLAGATVLFTSQTGATIAVNRFNGRAVWAYRNSQAVRPPVVSPRDLCPPLYSAGKVFLAPADSDAVTALDADSGAALWTVNGLQVEHLLGVTQGKLIATIHAPMKGIRGFNVNTGRITQPEGWQQHDDPYLGSYGRGLVADNLIAWPTKEKLYLLNASDGRVARPPVPGPHGNLAFADNIVFVATPTELWAYDFRTAPKPKSDIPTILTLATPNRPVPGTLDALQTPEQPQLDAVTRPAFAKTLRVVREARLPGCAVPLRVVGEHHTRLTLFADHRRVLALNQSDGKAAWDTPHSEPTVFHSVGFLTNNRAVLLGHQAVACVAMDTGKRLWQFQPVDNPLSFTAFTFVGSRLVAKWGEQALLAWELSSGELAWVLDSLQRSTASAFGLESTPAFGPYLGYDRASVVAQCHGERWDIDAETGKVLSTEATSLADWTTAPFVFHRNGLLVPSAQGGLAAYLKDRRTIGYEPNRPSSLTGSPPQARLFGREVLVAVPRNLGVELQRLSELRQGQLWPAPRAVPLPPVHLADADANDNAYYLPAESDVMAISRANGRELWTRELPTLPPGTAWQVKAGRTCLLVFASTALPKEPLPGVLLRLLRCCWKSSSATTLLGTTLTLFEAMTDCTLPLLVLDSATGEVLQRLDVPTFGSTVHVQFRSDDLLIHHGRGSHLLK